MSDTHSPVSTEDNTSGQAQIMAYVDVLDELDLRADLKTVPGDEHFDAVSAGEGHAWLFARGSNYPSASDFLDPFSCDGFANFSGLCSDGLDAAIDHAQQLQATGDPAAANREWVEIEHELIEEAFWVPFMTPLDSSAFSARTANIEVHPIWRVLQSRLWVQ